jgi:hypothetical protein
MVEGILSITIISGRENMAHRRSRHGNLNQAERLELHQQQNIARWVINGSKFKDQTNRESVVTIPTEYIYDYISEVVGQEPNPRCAPQQLDGTVTDVPNVFHFELFPREEETQ